MSHSSFVYAAVRSASAAALSWADEVGMALFRFDHGGSVEAVNAAAEGLVAEAGGPALSPPRAWPRRLSDRAGGVNQDTDSLHTRSSLGRRQDCLWVTRRRVRALLLVWAP